MAKNKTVIAIALFLMATIAVTLVTIPKTNAQTVRNVHSYIYVSVSNEVIGVNQEDLLVMWTADIPPDVGEAEGLVPGGRQAWYDIKIEVTTPSGNIETYTIDKSDPVGGGYVSYMPAEIGEYSFKAIFPETTKTFPNGDQTIYSAAESNPVTFTAQEEQIQPWPETPLPNNYWTRPISSASREWYQLTGNWMGGAADVWPIGAAGGTTNNFAYGLAPESAHILWSKPYYTGGIMDARFEDTGYQTSHYQGLRWSAIILDGIINYQPRYTAHWARGWTGVDLYTGETLFQDYNATMPSFGQIYNYESPNQHGGFAYLWVTSDVVLPDNITREPYPPGSAPETVPLTTQPGTQTWEMLDALTGNLVCYVANVSAGGTAVYGKDGSILRYNVANLGTRANPNYYLQVWNSSAITTMYPGEESTWAWQWRPQYGGHSNYNFRWRENLNAVHDGSTGFSLNVSIQSIVGPTNSRLNQTASIQAVREGEYVILATSGTNDDAGIAPAWVIALSLEDGNEGQKLWENTFTPPYAENWGAGFTPGMLLTGVYPEDGVIIYENRIELKRYAYDMKTGTALWESDPEPQLHYYGMSDNYYQGIFLSYGNYGGELYAYNITTGEILWTYAPENVGFESPYGNYPMRIMAIADGKIYTQTSEHSPTQPLYRGENLRCINATDGTEIWKILDFGTGLALADGCIVAFNNFDNEIYCLGKGPSATTVSAPKLNPALGSSVTITGSVTDQSSSGRRTANDIIDFTLKGTPAISDENMSAWMEYMFMQEPKPTDAKGVDVVLETLDPNGNFYEIGTTTCDINGKYGYAFTPEVPGTYQIIATFKGSASYGGSSDTTYFTVGEAPQTTPTAPPPEPSMADIYIVPGIIGIIVAIVAVGSVIILMLRKR